MSTFDKYWRTIPNRQGIFMTIALVAFFLLMRSLGLAHNYWLRALNIVIVFLFVRSAIVTYQRKSEASYYEDFFDFFKIGLRTSFVGIGIFAIFLAIYLDLIDTAFMQELQQFESFGSLISPVSVSFLIFLEGLGSAFVCCYLVIQLRKARTIEKPMQEKSKLQNEAQH